MLNAAGNGLTTTTTKREDEERRRREREREKGRTYLGLGREEGLDEDVGVGCAQVVVAEAARHADGGQHAAALALAVDDGELEVLGRDRLVRPARHVRLAVQQPLAHVAPSFVPTNSTINNRGPAQKSVGLEHHNRSNVQN